MWNEKEDCLNKDTCIFKGLHFCYAKGSCKHVSFACAAPIPLIQSETNSNSISHWIELKSPLLCLQFQDLILISFDHNILTMCQDWPPFMKTNNSYHLEVEVKCSSSSCVCSLIMLLPVVIGCALAVKRNVLCAIMQPVQQDCSKGFTWGSNSQQLVKTNCGVVASLQPVR